MITNYRKETYKRIKEDFIKEFNVNHLTLDLINYLEEHQADNLTRDFMEYQLNHC